LQKIFNSADIQKTSLTNEYFRADGSLCFDEIWYLGEQVLDHDRWI